MSKLSKFNIFVFVVFIIISTIFYSNKFSVVFGFLLLILLFLYNFKQSKKRLNKQILYIILFFFLISLLLILIDSNFIENISSTILVYFTILLLFLNISTQENKTEIFINVFKFFSIFVLFLIIYSCIVYFLGSKILLYNSETNTYYQKLNILGVSFIQSAVGDPKKGLYVGSLTGNPNTLSYLSVISIIYYLILSNCKKTKKIVCIIISIIGILISGSRLATTLIPIIIFLNIVVNKMDFTKKKNIYMLFFVVILFILLLLFNANSIFNSIDFNGRITNWEIGIKNISLFGHGINSDNIYLFRYYNKYTSMHNSYISLFVNYGIIFGTAILFVILKLLKNMLTATSKSKINKFIFVLFLTLLIMSLSESIFFINGLYNFLFFYLIILFVMKEANE